MGTHRHTSRVRITLAALTLPAALTLTPPAHAGNQNSFFLGNVAALTGGAVAVLGDDGASLWYNPAGLVAVRKNTLDLSGSAYMLRIRDYPGLVRGDLPDRLDADDPLLDLEATDIFSVPSAIAYVRTLSDDLSLGFGVFVPLMDGFSATSELTIREPANHLDASADIRVDTSVYAASVGLGWRAAPRLRLGASLGLFLQSAELAQTLLYGYDAPLEASPVQGNGSVLIEDSTTRVGFNVSLGAQWQVADDWALGLLVRTPIVQIYESFTRRHFRLGADVAPDGTPTIVTDFAPMRDDGFGASIYLNFSGVFALAWTPAPDTFLGLELELQPGSEDGELVRQLVWNARLGGMVPVSRTVRFGAGVFTDRSWEPHPTEAWRDRVNYYGVATGLHLETPLSLAGRPESDALVFTSTFALRYAIGFGETPRAVADPTGFRTDTPLHRLDLVFHEISLHVGSGLRF